MNVLVVLDANRIQQNGKEKRCFETLSLLQMNTTGLPVYQGMFSTRCIRNAMSISFTSPIPTCFRKASRPKEMILQLSMLMLAWFIQSPIKRKRKQHLSKAMLTQLREANVTYRQTMQKLAVSFMNSRGISVQEALHGSLPICLVMVSV